MLTLGLQFVSNGSRNKGGRTRRQRQRKAVPFIAQLDWPAPGSLCRVADSASLFPFRVPSRNLHEHAGFASLWSLLFIVVGTYQKLIISWKPKAFRASGRGGISRSARKWCVMNPAFRMSDLSTEQFVFGHRGVVFTYSVLSWRQRCWTAFRTYELFKETLSQMKHRFY